MNRHSLRCFLLIVLLFFVGCSSYWKQRQLERVAKDWALTIRASQVIPIYPLSADLQPGDIFLVQTPISRETDTYHDKGYLPLDLQFARLDLKGEFETFYKASYWEASFSKVPFSRPKRSVSDSPPDPGRLDVTAPSVAFPNYTFKVSTGGGLQLAIPISSVPVGLGLMAANTANGSVELGDAYTYGLSVEEIQPRLEAWASKNRAELRRLAQAYEDPVFLRIVTRIFFVGKIVVSLANADTGSGGLDVGAAKAIDLPALETDDPAKLEQIADAYKKAANAYKDVLNDLSSNLPGGSIRIAHASRRSVTLEEVFEEPKAVGYLGFDVQVNEDGTIGPPIPTFEKLEGKASSPEPVNYAPDKNSEIIRKWLERDPNNRKKLEEWLKKNNFWKDGIRIGHILNADFPGVRREIIDQFKLPTDG
jgi:hypothetical protein